MRFRFILCAVLFIASAGALTGALGAMWGGQGVIYPKRGGVGGGGSTSCDIGPNASVPLPAVNAGFTTCALNADFTTSTTDAHGVNFGNPNTWQPSCGASTFFNNTILRLQFFAFGSPGTTGDYPCGRLLMVSDGGSTVLNYNFTPTDAAHPWWSSDLTWPADDVTVKGPCVGGNCGGGPNGLGLWVAFYAELEYRSDATSFNQSPDPNGINILDFWSDACNGCGLPAPDFGGEIDFFEVTWDGVPSHLGPAYHGISFVNTSYDERGTYHRFAILATNDGSTSWICGYLDGGIDTATPAASCLSDGALGNFHGHMINFFAGGDATAVVNPVSVWIRHLRVFECANYWNAQCNGTLITH